MEQKLTAQIAAMYWNALIKCKHGVCKIKSIDFEDNTVWVIAQEGFYEAPMQLKNCHLILTPLSEISDEDAIEIAKMMSQDDNNALDPNDVPEWLSEVFTGNCATYADYVSGNEFIRLINFLRSKSYDCDGLIGKGLAIIKK